MATEFLRARLNLAQIELVSSSRVWHSFASLSQSAAGNHQCQLSADDLRSWRHATVNQRPWRHRHGSAHLTTVGHVTSVWMMSAQSECIDCGVWRREPSNEKKKSFRWRCSERRATVELVICVTVTSEMSSGNHLNSVISTRTSIVAFPCHTEMSTFPSKLHWLAFVQWVHGIKREILETEFSNYFYINVLLYTDYFGIWKAISVEFLLLKNKTIWITLEACTWSFELNWIVTWFISFNVRKLRWRIKDNIFDWNTTFSHERASSSRCSGYDARERLWRNVFDVLGSWY